MWSCADSVAVSLGDPAGVGVEIALEAWRRRKSERLPPFFLTGNADFLQRRAEKTGGVKAARLEDISESAEVFKKALPVWEGSRGGAKSLRVLAGKPSLAGGQEALRALRLATDCAMNGSAAALLTNPVSKAWLRRAGFRHNGQTEYLAKRAKSSALMMLIAEDLRVALVTTHIPLSAVPKAITRRIILEKGRALHQGLKKDFGIKRPKIAVAALNPHAGDDSLFGHEDAKVIAPAINDLKKENISASGPHPADSLFHKKRRAGYDAVLCMYHDQALIPLKMLGGAAAGVNISLGLDFVRTSPDHGTAFDIAGKGRADASSFIAALRLAKETAQRRARNRA